MPTSFDDIYVTWRMGFDLINRLKKVFVVGCAKSGTTWVQNVLNGHDEIVVGGEGCFTYQLVPLLAQAFNAFNRHQKEHNQAVITQMRDIDLALLGRTVMDSQLTRYLSASGKDLTRLRVIGDKTPQHTISLPSLNQCFPTALFIHIIRDPRDVATSAWNHFGKDGQRSPEDFFRYMITEVWPINVGTAREAAPQLGDRYFELRYEDLHANPYDVTHRLIEFLSVDSSKASVAKCVEAGDFKGRSGGRQRGQCDNKSLYRNGMIGDWQNHIPADLAERCCAQIAQLMTECGYRPAGAVAMS